ncbi:hypothetical protein [Filifactor alocis]
MFVEIRDFWNNNLTISVIGMKVRNITSTVFQVSWNSNNSKVTFVQGLLYRVTYRKRMSEVCKT